MTKFRRHISQPRKVCGRDIEEIKYVGMQSHGHTHGLQPVAVRWWLIKVSRCDSLQTDHWVIMYLTNTIPYICFVVNTLIQYLVQPRWVHLVVAKHVMRYLKGTIDFGLYYDGSHEYRLYGYTDAYWARSISDRKSASVICFCLRSAMSSWFSRKKSSVSLSTTEAEYIADCYTKL